MYPGFATQATADNCPAAAALFTEIAVDEGGHAAAYTVALQSLTIPKVRVPTPQTVDPVVITASTPACTGQTQVNLLDAMHGEAFAYAKYTAYALQAARTHQTALAKLFSGTAQVELQEHFAAEAVLAGLVGTNAANLQDSITGETWEHTTMYPGFATQATADNCPAAAALFTEIAVDEGGHAAAYTLALQSLNNPKVKVPKPQTVDPVVITASTPACPGTQTQVNLLDAMHGEAFAYAKYTAYALQAARTHQTALAKLFSGTAQVELQEHFAAEAVLAGLVGTNAANLQDSITGETWEHTTMYPGFATQATADNCPAAAALFTEIAVAEGGHAAAYTLALQALTDSAVKVPKPQTVDPVVITASTPACTGQTQVNLLAAMHGEAFAYAKYTAYALQAARTGQTALAKLFSGTAQVELQEHFAGEAVLAGLVGTNAANLQDSITGETWEHTTMYPGFATQATADNCPA